MDEIDGFVGLKTEKQIRALHIRYRQCQNYNTIYIQQEISYNFDVIYIKSKLFIMHFLSLLLNKSFSAIIA